MSDKKTKPRDPKKTWGNKCDVMFSKLIRKKGFCEWPCCGRVENLQCSHIYTRDLLSVRWDLKNAFCFCAGCHKYKWHMHPTMAIEVAKLLLGEYEYSELTLRARSMKYDLTIEELQEKYKQLEDIYNDNIHKF